MNDSVARKDSNNEQSINNKWFIFRLLIRLNFFTTKNLYFSKLPSMLPRSQLNKVEIANLVVEVKKYRKSIGATQAKLLDNLNQMFGSDFAPKFMIRCENFSMIQEDLEMFVPYLEKWLEMEN